MPHPMVAKLERQLQHLDQQRAHAQHHLSDNYTPLRRNDLVQTLHYNENRRTEAREKRDQYRKLAHASQNAAEKARNNHHVQQMTHRIEQLDTAVANSKQRLHTHDQHHRQAVQKLKGLNEQIHSTRKHLEQARHQHR